MKLKGVESQTGQDKFLNELHEKLREMCNIYAIHCQCILDTHTHIFNDNNKNCHEVRTVSTLQRHFQLELSWMVLAKLIPMS